MDLEKAYQEEYEQLLEAFKRKTKEITEQWHNDMLSLRDKYQKLKEEQASETARDG